MRRRSEMENNQRFGMDILAAFMLFFSTIIGAFVYTQTVDADLVLASKVMFMPVLAWSGVLARALITGWDTAKPVGGPDVVKIMLGGSVALVAIIAIMNAPVTMSSVELGNTIFYANMGIIEEVFFNYALFAIVATATVYGALGGFLAVGVVFPLFHIGVYGVDPNFFVLAFAARIVLCTVYYVTGHLSSAMVAHVAFNVLASPGSVIGFGGA